LHTLLNISLFIRIVVTLIDKWSWKNSKLVICIVEINENRLYLIGNTLSCRNLLSIQNMRIYGLHSYNFGAICLSRVGFVSMCLCVRHWLEALPYRHYIFKHMLSATPTSWVYLWKYADEGRSQTEKRSKKSTMRHIWE